VSHPDRPQPGDDQLTCVFVNWVVAEEDHWTAVWQQPGDVRTVDGTRAEVVSWALAQPAERYWIFSSEADDWVPLRAG
jgi:hypothetical protein